MASTDSLIGQLVADRYRLLERVGAGAAGAVFVGVDEQGDQQADRPSGRSVVVKLLRPQYTATAETEARFRLEAQIAASLAQPNLNAVYDFGVDDVAGTRLAFVVSEPLGGASLRDMLDRGRLLSPSQALMVGLDVCRGLDAMHRAGVIH
ncbi:MAG TPA: protein kinase, partial [Ilumatobacteraceae bacterium]|nr:protein kinase [Ilumatobacteraceae bacterium]